MQARADRAAGLAQVQAHSGRQLAHDSGELQELRSQLQAAKAGRAACERQVGELEASLVAQERLVAALKQQGAAGAAAEAHVQVRGARGGGVGVGGWGAGMQMINLPLMMSKM
jgi:hypothetical protein